MIAALTLCVSVSLCHAQNIASPKTRTPVIAGSAYVQFKGPKVFDLSQLTNSRTGNPEVDAYFDEIGVTKIERFDPNPNLDIISRSYGVDRMFHLTYSNSELDARKVADGLLALKAVRSASPHFVFSACYDPNDPRLGDEYAITKMNVKTAWNYSKGDSNTVVAITDDGVNYNHEDLQGKMYLNLGEMGVDSKGNDKRSNGIDDDRDGYKDNWHGWDFIGSGDADVISKWKPDNDAISAEPNRSHGTEVSGCAVAATDNGIGVAGTGFNCRFLPVKMGDDKNNLSAGYEAIQYSGNHGARVINCSWGGDLEPQYIAFAQTLIDVASAHGALVVASSGNDGLLDNDINPFYPANLDGVLSVGATEQNDKPTSFSHFGKSVDCFAPGSGVFSIGYPGNTTYDPSFGGTSASAPLVSGICGLMFSKFPEWTPKFVARQIVETCDNVVNTANREKYWGRVNAGNALSKPSYVGLVIKGDKVDGEADASLQYIYKKYDLTVNFKNVVADGTNLIAILQRNDGYTVDLGVAQLGNMATSKETEGSFQFTRDGNDDGEFLRLSFVVTSGTKYRDTLRLVIPISASDEWVQKVVRNETGDISFGESYPNPAADMVTIPFRLAKTEEISMTVTDVLGRSVYQRSTGMYDAGSHQFSIATRDLAKGMYYYTASLASGKRFSGQFVVVK